MSGTYEMKGLFITFEGMDGVGKSTQIRLISDYLRELGLPVLNTREPGGCKISEQVRAILLSVDNMDMCDRCEALLYAAARAQHMSEIIIPALSRGEIVVCDRFVDSSIAYQGYGRELGAQSVQALSDFATEGITPDKTFFLYLDPEHSFARMNEQKVRDRLEMQSADYYARVFSGYVAQAEKCPRIEMIDVSGTKQETQEKIRAKMERLLREKGML